MSSQNEILREAMKAALLQINKDRILPRTPTQLTQAVEAQPGLRSTYAHDLLCEIIDSLQGERERRAAAEEARAKAREELAEMAKTIDRLVVLNTMYLEYLGVPHAEAVAKLDQEGVPASTIMARLQSEVAKKVHREKLYDSPLDALRYAAQAKQPNTASGLSQMMQAREAQMKQLAQGVEAKIDAMVLKQFMSMPDPTILGVDEVSKIPWKNFTDPGSLKKFF